MEVTIDKREMKEVELILGRFVRSYHYYTVAKIERIYNEKLERIYRETHKQFKDQKRPTDEVIMFHGTASINVPKSDLTVHMN